MRGEIKPLTALRAIAAALVFFYHFVYLRNPVPAHNVIDVITQTGFVGVNLMFVLSGSVLTLRYYGDVEQKKLRWGEYIKRRVVRLYPSYFVLLAAIALLGVPINLANVTITQGFFTRYFQTGIINSWSLTSEECFYFLLPILLIPLIRIKGLAASAILLFAWAVGLLALGLGLVRWANVSGVAAQSGFMGDDIFALTRTFFGFGLEFGIGMFAALLYRRRGAYGVIASSILAMLGVVGIALCMVLMTLYPDPVPVRALRYVASIFCGALVLALTCEGLLLSRVLSWRPFVYLGRLSYGVYLIQLTQVVWFMAGWPVWLFYIGCNAASALLYHLVELPARQVFLKHPKPVPATAPALIPATAPLPEPVLAAAQSATGARRPTRDYSFAHRTN